MTPAAVDASRSQALPRRRWDAMVTLIVVIFALVLGVNGAMLWFTLSNPIQLVSSSYYEESKNYGQVMDEARASDATGWGIEIVNDGAATPGRTVVAIVDRSGRPVTGLTGSIHAYRPSDAALDEELPVSELSALPGRYEAHFRRPTSGRWELRFSLARGAARFAKSLDWVAP